MADTPNPWHDSFMPSREDLEAHRQDKYEEAVVGHILKRLKLQHKAKEVRSFYKSERGFERLGFAGLYACTEFPVELGTRKLPHITAETLLEMVNRPTKTSIFKAFAELVDEYPDAAESGRLGLVFSWPGWSKFMLFHTMDTTHYQMGTRMIWYPGKSRQPHLLETLDTFLMASGLVPELEDDDASD